MLVTLKQVSNALEVPFCSYRSIYGQHLGVRLPKIPNFGHFSEHFDSYLHTRRSQNKNFGCKRKLRVSSSRIKYFKMFLKSYVGAVSSQIPLAPSVTLIQLLMTICQCVLLKNCIANRHDPYRTIQSVLALSQIL